VKANRVYLSKRLQIGKGEPKETLDAARDGVSIGIRGDWVVLRDEATGRTCLVHGSRTERVELDANDGLELLTEPETAPPKGRR
jgi:hypothetical protein